MLALVEVVSGAHAGKVGVKLARSDESITLLPLHATEAVRVKLGNAKQMFDIPRSHALHDQFSGIPSDRQLRELWHFVQSSFDARAHAFHPGCPRRVRQKMPSSKRLVQMYQRQPVLRHSIRVVPCVTRSE